MKLKSMNASSTVLVAEKKQKSIVILICYFGEMPWYFNYFIHSCQYNTSIDFILISDTIQFKFRPANVKHIYMTLEDVNILATQRLGFPTSIQTGYKLCDFKPAYGFLFPDLVVGYDFWGQSDIDVIYGDIRNFMNQDMLESFDYLSVRHDYPTGCFSLFRNNFFINTIFKRSKNYKNVFSSSENFCFDECNWVHESLTEGKQIFEIATEIESFMHIIKSAERKNEIKTHFDFILIEGIPGKIKFDRGKMIYKNTFEVILYHLLQLKKVYNPKRVPRRIPHTYHISPTRFYS